LYEICLDVTFEQGILGRPEHDSDEGRKVKLLHFAEARRESHYHLWLSLVTKLRLWTDLAIGVVEIMVQKYWWTFSNQTRKLITRWFTIHTKPADSF